MAVEEVKHGVQASRKWEIGPKNAIQMHFHCE